MRKSRFTAAQIIGMIKEQEAGMPTVEVCRRQGLCILWPGSRFWETDLLNNPKASLALYDLHDT